MQRHLEKRKSAAEMAKTFQRHCQTIESKLVSEISVDDAHVLQRQISTKSGPYASNRVMQLLRATYNKGKEWQIVDFNPFRSVTSFKESPRARVLSADEIGRLMQALRKANQNTQDFVFLLLLTGARKSELGRMRWDQIDFQARTWTIPETKNGSTVVVALSDTEMQVLLNRQECASSKWVFPSNSKSGHVLDIKTAWRALLKEARIHGLRQHDLRRTVGSMLASMNVNASIIKGVLHHKDLRTTLNTYAFSSSEAEREAKQRLHDLLGLGFNGKSTKGESSSAGDRRNRLLLIRNTDDVKSDEEAI